MQIQELMKGGGGTATVRFGSGGMLQKLLRFLCYERASGKI